jgi:hypothetical protein
MAKLPVVGSPRVFVKAARIRKKKKRRRIVGAIEH